MVGCWVGSSVEEGWRHSLGESGEESPEEDEDGDSPGDGSYCAGASCKMRPLHSRHERGRCYHTNISAAGGVDHSRSHGITYQEVT
jgi:hypothetical protein